MNQSNRRLHNQRKKLMQFYDGRCFYCGELATELDHLIPLLLGGRGCYGNKVPSCAKCNRTKGHTLIEKFRPDLVPKVEIHWRVFGRPE